MEFTKKTPYILLQILPMPWKFYTMPDGVDGNILQVWFQAFQIVQHKAAIGDEIISEDNKSYMKKEYF